MSAQSVICGPRQKSCRSLQTVSRRRRWRRAAKWRRAITFLSVNPLQSVTWGSHKSSTCLWVWRTSAVLMSSSGSLRGMTRTREKRESLTDGEVVSEDSRTLSGTQTLFSAADSRVCVEPRQQAEGGAARSASTTTTWDTIVTVTTV